MTRVLFASSEIYPLVKTGGLGDVSHSLPIALHEQGADLRVIVPGYSAVMASISDSTPLCDIQGFMIPDNTRLLETHLPDSKIKLWVVDCPAFFQREGGPYQDSMKQEWPDNAHRFAAFCRAIVEVALGNTDIGWQPDVVHANDWQTGLVPALLALAEARPASVFTIHNLAYQGNFPKSVFDELMLPQEWWNIDAVEFYHKMSFLKAGVVFADKVTTVSPTYAKEVLTADYGFGMDGLLSHYQDKLSGILNGVDYNTWNPEHDSLITFNYSAGSLDDKIKNKLDLQRKLGLKLTKGTPLFGMVSRLVSQKGIDCVLRAIQETLDQKSQWVILGSGEEEFEQGLKALAAQHPEKIAVTIGYDEALAHKIEAACDVFVMPSRYEPCGLNQFYSLRYGTLPLVRATGGLADSVVNIDDESIADGSATGFVFSDPNAESLIAKIEEAIAFYRKKKKWRATQLTAMAQDYSWRSSAVAYLKLYGKALISCRNSQYVTE